MHDNAIAHPSALTSSDARPPARSSDDALDRLLILGSDSRLHLDQGRRLNGYGCQPSPRPYEISFSSSTASTISQRAYSAAEAGYRDLCRSTPAERDGALALLAAATKQNLKTYFDLNDCDVEVVLSPSGTDSELQALFLARSTLGRFITSIVVAADETGSGVALAAAGRHFGVLSSSGRPVAKGEVVRGLGTNTKAVSIEARDQFGLPRPLADIDDEVRRSVSEAIAAGHDVVLHLMDHSKLGSRSPSLECVQDICTRWGNAIRVVVDACQARLSRKQLRRYLDLGFMVITTGSKFFTGPPLSGALFVPGFLRPNAAIDSETFSELCDYSTRYDWPECWTSVREHLPDRANIGQLLRWTAALEEIRAYFAVPELFRKIVLTEFAAFAQRVIAEYSNLRILPQPDWLSLAADDGDEFCAQTIFPFVVTKQGRPLTLAESRILYQALNQDLSPLFRSKFSAGDMDLVARVCHIGQPVSVGDRQVAEAGAIRISAGARLVSESWSAAHTPGAMEKMRAMIGGLRVVLDKIQLIAPHIDELAKHTPDRWHHPNANPGFTP